MRTPKKGPTWETQTVVEGRRLTIRWSQRERGYSAEVEFAPDDRFALDAPTLSELAFTLECALPAVLQARAIMPSSTSVVRSAS